MTTFSVLINVEEVVDGLKGLIEELSTRYLFYIIVGLSALLAAIVLASCLGATCAMCCYYKCCRRRRRKPGTKKKTYFREDFIEIDV